jgi:hypothetical protein
MDDGQRRMEEVEKSHEKQQTSAEIYGNDKRIRRIFRDEVRQVPSTTIAARWPKTSVTNGMAKTE